MFNDRGEFWTRIKNIIKINNEQRKHLTFADDTSLFAKGERHDIREWNNSLMEL